MRNVVIVEVSLIIESREKYFNFFQFSAISFQPFHLSNGNKLNVLQYDAFFLFSFVLHHSSFHTDHCCRKDGTSTMANTVALGSLHSTMAIMKSFYLFIYFLLQINGILQKMFECFR